MGNKADLNRMTEVAREEALLVSRPPEKRYGGKVSQFLRSTRSPTHRKKPSYAALPMIKITMFSGKR